MSTKADYYETLGVGRNASEAEIKQAFRTLARQYHPDVNKDPNAEARFKEINEAYETLRDPQKRRAYDLFGHSNGRSGGYPRGVDPADMGGIGDIFEAFFGVGARPSARSGPETGADLRMDLTLDFAEAVFGAEKDIEVSRLESCPGCEGSGAEPGSKIGTCTACKGQGQVRRMQSNFFGQFTTVATCSRCGGEGRVPTVRCGTCTGSGRTKQSRTISVKVPAGVDTGLRIRLGGQGEAGPKNGPRGDLYVFVTVRPDERFEREDDDIHVDYRVNFAQAALGDTVVIPTLEGNESLDIPAGTQSGSTFTLRRRGVPHLNGGGRGDQHVHVHVETPKRLSAHQKELLNELAKSFGGATNPQDDKGFFDKMKDALG
ncbi:MAG: molecular chaperone DnaJ [Chloroflexota bacterium]|nr:molecular chaperone DnaJ [Chloroflexota bacterium]MDE2840331.1 molecular chaperone DnaJ [Chloroflexota bacterium]